MPRSGGVIHAFGPGIRRGSSVGTRKDLQEALAFAAEGKVKTHIRTVALDDINNVFDALRAGTVDGRIVLDMSLRSPPQGKGELAQSVRG